MLKVGPRKLFIRQNSGEIREIMPLCVLDFYVHESVQRGGHGKMLFEEMLRKENDVHPAKLAYDRPSPKLIGFLGKHYGLKSYVPQNNNYIVFNQYWDPNPPPINKSSAATSYQPFAPPAASNSHNSSQPAPLPKAQRTVRFANDYSNSAEKN